MDMYSKIGETVKAGDKVGKVIELDVLNKKYTILTNDDTKIEVNNGSNQ